VVAGECGVVHHGTVERQDGGHAADGELGERAPGALQGLRPACPGHDQLADQRVERLRHRLARAVPGVQPDAWPGRGHPLGDGARRGQEVPRRVLGVDTELDGVPAQLRVVVAELLAVGDAEHLPDQVDAADLLGDRVLDLEPGVHLEEADGAVGGDEELAGARADVAGRAQDRLRRGIELLDLRVGQERRGRLLNQLLVPPLQRAVAGRDDDDVAVRVGQALGLHVPRAVQVPLGEALAVAERRRGLAHGRLVLAGDLGPEVRRNDSDGDSDNDDEKPRKSSAPPVVVGDKPLDQWLKPESGKPGWFKTTGAGLSPDIEFAPLYELPRREYAVYWDVFTPEEWSKRSAEYKAEQEKQQKLQAATIAFAQPGEMQTERDFNEQGEDSAPVLWRNRHGRAGKGWFSFDMPVENSRPIALCVTYGGDGRRKSTLDILIDGKKIGDYSALPRSPEQDANFVDANYAIPTELIGEKQKVTVRFQATDGNEIRGIFGVRTVRADEAR